MRLKKLVASAIVASALLSSTAVPICAFSNEVSASSFELNYAAASTNMEGIQAFVTRMYKVCLDRNPDEDGLNNWSNQLANKEATGCSVAFGFVFSAEFTNKNCSNSEFVDYMYAAFFGREPDEGGRNNWLNSLNSGSSRESVFAGFANSEEFANLCAKYGVVKGYYMEGYNHNQVAKVNLFVERLYNVVLGRTCDEGGMAGWTSDLVTHKQTGCSVAYGFVFSAEFANKNACNSCFVDVLYSAFLGRTPDADGKNTWVNKLVGAASRESVFGGFAGSLEFANICADYGIEPGNLNGITSNTFGGGKCGICGATAPVITPIPTPSNTPVVITTPVPSSFTGLAQQEGDLYYYENGKMVRGWVTIKDPNRWDYYYFNPDTGKAVYGWQVIDGKEYYFLDSGIEAIGFCQIDGKTYYFDPEYGYMLRRWVYVDSDEVPFYFDPETGAMVTGWYTISYKDEDTGETFSDTFYFNSDGKMHQYWLEENGKKYYFSSYGSLKTGLFSVEDKYYYSNDKGELQFGWLNYSFSGDSKVYRYYFAPSTGIAATGWTKIDNNWYFFSNSGVMSNGWYIDANSKRYYLGTDGARRTGWQTIENKKYYFNGDGIMQTGIQTIDGKKYYFTTSGILQTGFQTIGNNRYYFDNNGVMATGWQTIEGKKYCFTSDGVMYTGIQTIGSNKYIFDTYGRMLTGLQDYNGKRYFLGDDGIMYISKWRSIESGGTKYWFYYDETGAMIKSDWRKIDGKWYYFEYTGQMVTGWHSEMENNEKVWYYFDSNGVMITGWKEIGSSWYYFASSGKMATSSWQKDSKGRYSYLKSNGVACVSEFYKIDGKYYYFDADGIMATSNVTVKGKTYIIKSSGEVTNY